MSKINQVAADWWAQRWEEDATRDAFRQALIEMLPDGDWKGGSDYDPWGVLLPIVQRVKPDCRGCCFSSQGILPTKTNLVRKDDKLTSKEGYGSPFVQIWPAPH